ncbi:MAG: hypothetical protein ACR2QC_02960 [Gammaproteobacteria bacterium]
MPNMASPLVVLKKEDSTPPGESRNLLRRKIRDVPFLHSCGKQESPPLSIPQTARIPAFAGMAFSFPGGIPVKYRFLWTTNC